MGKNSEKTGLGRALVKHHNHMIQESKEKGRVYNSKNKKILESVTEVNDIDAVIQQAQEDEDEQDPNNLIHSSLHHPPNHLINLDGNTDLTPEERREQQKIEEALHASSLRVPRRPRWHAAMSKEEVDANERHAFLLWRRSLVKLEQNEKLVLTPFEKNLDIWRQLWRVLERSDLVVMVVDARDPLFYRCPDLEAYAQEIDEHKKAMLLVNKADLLPVSVREKWAKYFNDNGILFLFWSAKAANDTVEGKKLREIEEKQSAFHSLDVDSKIYGKDELLTRLQAEAEAISATKRHMDSKITDAHSLKSSNTGSNSAPKHVVVGFVGYPNVGKSSTINALVGEKRTGVTSTPGKTKHFQTLVVSDELVLCDCPGLVFPSFTSSRYEMIASGVLPIDRMTQHRDAVQVVADRVPRIVIEKVYNIKLPKPKPYESQSRPPLASELLRAYCRSRGYVASSGLPDETRSTREILKDYLDGKLPHFEMPPGNSPSDADWEVIVGPRSNASAAAACDKDSSDTENRPAAESTNTTNLEHVFHDLDSFDMGSGMPSTKAVPAKQKPPTSSHKQHRKPQRKKERSWRAGNDEGDGMPMVKVFAKRVNIGPMTVG